MRYDIRSERPGDEAAIAEVNRLAFGRDDEGRLVAAIRHGDGFNRGLSWVATVANEVAADRVVGHILFSPIHVETARDSAPALALAPMAVHPDRQRQGIGSALVRRGLDGARVGGHRIVIVVGHPDYYPRFGFTPAVDHGLQAPFPVPDEAFMALALVPDGLDGVVGVVRYPPVFDEM